MAAQVPFYLNVRAWKKWKPFVFFVLKRKQTTLQLLPPSTYYALTFSLKFPNLQHYLQESVFSISACFFLGSFMLLSCFLIYSFFLIYSLHSSISISIHATAVRKPQLAAVDGSTFGLSNLKCKFSPRNQV